MNIKFYLKVAETIHRLTEILGNIWGEDARVDIEVSPIGFTLRMAVKLKEGQNETTLYRPKEN